MYCFCDAILNMWIEESLASNLKLQSLCLTRWTNIMKQFNSELAWGRKKGPVSQHKCCSMKVTHCRPTLWCLSREKNARIMSTRSPVLPRGKQIPAFTCKNIFQEYTMGWVFEIYPANFPEQTTLSMWMTINRTNSTTTVHRQIHKLLHCRAMDSRIISKVGTDTNK